MGSIAAAQEVVWSLPGPQAGDGFGYCLDVTEDFDGDGFAEIVVGAPFHDAGSSLDVGAAHLYSADSDWLLTWINSRSSSTPTMGALIGFVGDVNGDGVADWGVTSNAGNGGLEIISALDGAVLMTLDGLGSNVCVDHAGDLDGDGREDFLVGAPSQGMVRVYSGATGSVIHELVEGSPVTSFGFNVLGVGDVTGDGVPDFAVGAGGAPPAKGFVRMYSGADGNVRWQRDGATGSVQTLEQAGDLDEDGASDLAVSEGSSEILVLASASGAVLRSFEPTWGNVNVSAGGGDLDGDLVPDLWAQVYNAFGADGIRAFSGASGRPLVEFAHSSNGWPHKRLRFIGDIDGDGADESVFGDPNAGLAVAYAGEPGLQCSTYWYEGGSEFGRALANVGDLDADGFDDLVIGAPYASAGGSKRGLALPLSLGSGVTLPGTGGPTSGQLLGYSATGLGDLDGNGIPDYVIGAPAEAGSGLVGEVWVWSGGYPQGSLIRKIQGTVPDSLFGWTVADVGDLDGDSIHDLAVGEPNYDLVYPDGGAVSLFSGATGSLLANAEQNYLGSDHQFGRSIAGLGDVDGDGVPDYAVGAPGSGTTGQAGYCRLYSGADPLVILRTINGLAPGDFFGDPVVNAGDFDADGIDDFAVGAMHADPNGTGSGQVRVISSATGNTLLTIDGQAAGERLGRSIALLGDQDCDGVPEFLLGGDDQGPYPGGFARVVSGATGAEIALFTGIQPAIEFGQAVANAGDVNGDGRDDVAIAAPEAPWGTAAAAGHVKVYTLNPRFVRPKTYCSAKESSLGCLPSISYAGSPRASSGCDDFTIHASGVIGQADGFLLWGLAPNQHGATGTFKGKTIGSQSPSPYGGVSCVGQPQRIGRQSSGGTAGQCDGAFAFHFDQAFMAANGLLAGDTVYAQWWYSDPFHPDGTGIGHSDALSFTLKP